MINFFRTSLLCLLISSMTVSPFVLGQVYKFIDENGNVTYSDTPPAEKQDMQPAELPEIFIQPGVEVTDRPAAEEPKANDISISISTPEEGTSILGSQANFRVSASTSRKLSNGEQIKLMVNGIVHSTAPTLNWTVTDLIRGEYVLSVEVIDKSGKIIANSAPVRIFVQRNIR